MTTEPDNLQSLPIPEASKDWENVTSGSWGPIQWNHFMQMTWGYLANLLQCPFMKQEHKYFYGTGLFSS